MADPTAPTGLTTDTYEGPPGQTSYTDVPSGNLDNLDPFQTTRDVSYFLDRHNIVTYGGKPEVSTPVQAGKGVAPNYQPVPLMQPDEANQRYGIPGKLAFTTPTPEPVAQSQNAEMRDYLTRQFIDETKPAGVFNRAIQFGTSVAAKALDPLNLAAALVPVLGEERTAAIMASVGDSILARTAARGAIGFAGGVVGNVPLVAAQYGLAKEAHQDFDMTDVMTNLLYGGLLGGGAHAAVGAVGDFWHGMPDAVTKPIQGAPPELQGDAMKATVGQLAGDQMPTPGAIYEAHEMKLFADLPTLNMDTLQVLAGYRHAAALPNIDMGELGRVVEEAGLTEKAGTLGDQLASLPPGDPSAADRLTRLAEVDRQLQGEPFDTAERKALENRRDQILVDTNPEKLQEAAAPLEQRRQLEAQIQSLQDRMAEIQQERARLAAGAALSDMPKLGGALESGIKATDAPHALALTEFGRQMQELHDGPSAAFSDAINRAAGHPTPAQVEARARVDEIAKAKPFDEQHPDISPERMEDMKLAKQVFEQDAQINPGAVAEHQAQLDQIREESSAENIWGKVRDAIATCPGFR